VCRRRRGLIATFLLRFPPHIDPATEASAADVTFTCEQEAFALLLCGRLGLESALQARRLLTTGDPAVVQTFTQWFQGA
jgi:SCP-2 sterol transfer family